MGVNARCGDCGHRWRTRGPGLPARCPACGVRLRDWIDEVDEFEEDSHPQSRHWWGGFGCALLAVAGVSFALLALFAVCCVGVLSSG